MKKANRQINWIIKIIGLLTIRKAAIYLASLERGYFAIGGEYLVIPLILSARYLFEEVQEYIRLYR